MLESGYIKLHRSFLSWEWYSDANTARVFLHLILTANRKPQQWQGITIERGQRVSSFSKLGQELGLSAKEIRTAIKHLTGTGEVAHTPTSKYGLFTVLKYDEFQGRALSETVSETPEGPSQGAQPGTRRTTNEEREEREKKEKKIPPLSPNGPFTAFAGDDLELLDTLLEFESMRKRMKAPLTERAKTLVVGRLKKLSSEARDSGRYCRECLEKSIVNNWKDVFPLKEFADVYEPPPAVRVPDSPVVIDPGHVNWEDLVP